MGYNNMLKQAATGMTLGVNNGVNLGTKSRLGIDGRRPIKNQSPFKPDPQGRNGCAKPKDGQQAAKTPDSQHETEETFSEKTPQHEMNKTAVIVGVVGVVALLFMAMR